MSEARAVPDPIFEPLEFRNLTIKNRLVRSSVSGRFDQYDGTGSVIRVRWEEKFARGGVGAIISSYAPVHVHGRIMPNYALIDDDATIPFWRSVVAAVHAHDCRYIIQLSHGGRQRDMPGVDTIMRPGLAASTGNDEVFGLYAREMTPAEIQEVVEQFARAAVRARHAGADGVELHASHGYLVTQFLSSALNKRTDGYGGSLENRARFLLEIIRAIRREVGDDYHVQAKLNAVDMGNYLLPWRPPGNSPAEGVKIARWAVEAGLDAVHVSLGSTFPHPLMPPGGWPPDVLRHWLHTLGDSGIWSTRNHMALANPVLRPVFLYSWNRVKRHQPVEGVAADLSGQVRRGIDVPVICTGGFQDAGLIRRVLTSGQADAVSMARPLIANPDLPRVLASGRDGPDRPCSFCNRCLIHVVANPLGCYDVRRFDGDHDAMINEVTAIFKDSFPATAGRQEGAG